MSFAAKGKKKQTTKQRQTNTLHCPTKTISKNHTSSLNERSHRTLNNMLCARLLEGSSSKAWVDKVPGIMLSLNAMSHEPHGFSASMVATGREPTLLPDVQQGAHASPAVDDPSDYVEVITQRLQLTHQQMASLSPPTIANPYQEGSHLCDEDPS